MISPMSTRRTFPTPRSAKACRAAARKSAVSKGLTRGANLKVVSANAEPKGALGGSAPKASSRPDRQSAHRRLAHRLQSSISKKKPAFKRDYEERAKEFVEEVETRRSTAR